MLFRFSLCLHVPYLVSDVCRWLVERRLKRNSRTFSTWSIFWVQILAGDKNYLNRSSIGRERYNQHPQNAATMYSYRASICLFLPLTGSYCYYVSNMERIPTETDVCQFKSMTEKAEENRKMSNLQSLVYLFLLPVSDLPFSSCRRLA